MEQGEFIHYNEDGFPVMVVKFRDGAEIRIDGERIPAPYFPGEVTP